MYRRHVLARYRLLSHRVRRFVLYRMLHADDPPYRLAMGVTVGVFITFTPTIGLQMILVVLLAWMLRANAVVGIPIVWLSNPVTIVPIYYPLYRFGAWLLSEPAVGRSWFVSLVRDAPQGWWAGVRHYGEGLLEVAGPLWAGCMFFAVAISVPTYYVTYYAIWGYRMRKWGSLAPPGSPRAMHLAELAQRSPPAPAMQGRRLVLASASPRRADLLRESGYAFTVMPSGYDESTLDTTGLSPRAIAAELAHRKARALAEPLDDGLVLAADTLLAVDGQAIGKPADEADARRVLRLLIGRTHEVITAVALVDAVTGEEHAFSDVARVSFGPMDDAAFEAYVAGGAWRDKAGGYNLAELGEGWTFAIEGDPATVIGLPMQRLADELRKLLNKADGASPGDPGPAKVPA